MHWFKRNIGDYHKKAGRLTMIQHGAYTLLMDACYDRERFPTLDEALEWTWASSSEDIAAVEFVLSRFFTVRDGVYVQSRIEEEVANYNKTAEVNKRIAQEREAKRRGDSTKRDEKSTKRDEKSTKRDEKSTKRDEKSTKRERVVYEPTTTPERHVHESPPNQELRTINQEPRTKNQEVTKDLSSKHDTTVTEVFEHWRLVMGKGATTKLTPKRKKAIAARVKDGYPLSEIKAAISNVSRSPFHMGQNDRQTAYNDIELICRSGEKLEQFRDNLDAPVEQRQYSTITEKNINNTTGDW